MNKILIMTVISVLTIAIIGSSSLPNVLAKEKVTRGPITCEDVGGEFVRCCQVETGSGGIEIRYCTVCDATNPPSNCIKRFIYDPALSNPTTPSGENIDKDQVLPPPKSNEGSSQKNGMNLEQALAPSKSN